LLLSKTNRDALRRYRTFVLRAGKSHAGARKVEEPCKASDQPVRLPVSGAQLERPILAAGGLARPFRGLDDDEVLGFFLDAAAGSRGGRRIELDSKGRFFGRRRKK